MSDTRTTGGGSGGGGRAILYIIIALGLSGFAFRKFYKTNKGRQVVDGLALRAPIFGVLIRKVAVAKFSRTMGTMLASGVAIGADPGSPVTDKYDAPFAFSGTLYNVTIDVSGELIVDSEAEMRAIMARQ